MKILSLLNLDSLSFAFDTIPCLKKKIQKTVLVVYKNLFNVNAFALCAP